MHTGVCIYVYMYLLCAVVIDAVFIVLYVVVWFSNAIYSALCGLMVYLESLLLYGLMVYLEHS